MSSGYTLLVFTYVSVSTKITASYKNPADVQQRAENVGICLEIMKTEGVELYGIQAEGNSWLKFIMFEEREMIEQFFDLVPTQQTNTFSKSTIGTLEEGVKYV